MSGRSAYVRKKITEPSKASANQNPALRGRANSVGSSRSSRPDGGFDYSQSNTGYGTTNSHLLKFSELHRDAEHVNYNHEPPLGYSSGSQSGTSENGRLDGSGGVPRHQGPMPDYAYARVRKPVLRTEDVSGIERSGFRSNMDKRSEEVRKGLSKALFSFGGKKKNAKKNDEFPSSPTPVNGHRNGDMMMDEYETMSVQMPPPSIAELQGPPTPTFSPPQSQQPPWDQYGRSQQQPQPTMPPPTAKLPPIPQTAGTQPIKRWVGGGRPVQRWNKLRKDPELWDPNGDVLIYLGHRGQNPRPNPSFRLSSHIIEATESRYLIALLREGSTEEDDIHGYLPPSPIGAPPMVLPPRHKPAYPSHYGYLRPNDGGIAGQPTPPVSDAASSQAGGGNGTEADGQISYEMFFPTPKGLSKTEAHRHAITTRNLFALLHHASLVGLSLFQALSDLHARLDEYMPPEADNVGTLLNYLSARGIDDPRNDPETAVSILAWSETPEVRWEEGWREAFLHCAGMMTMHGFSSAPAPSSPSNPSSATPGSLEHNATDYRHLTPITRALLERACLETQIRVQSAEDRLATFDFSSDMWPRSSSSSSSPQHRQAADRLQRFLRSHYAKMYGGSWPPPPPLPQPFSSSDNSGATSAFWLTRPLAQQLQLDFGALYDHLVDRSVVWDEDENRSGRKWIMLCSSSSLPVEGGDEGSSGNATSPTLSSPPLLLTDLLIEFDNRHRYPHIPHPYPLVPDCPPPSGGGNNATKDNLFERRVRLAYTEATNIYLLGDEEAEADAEEERQDRYYYQHQYGRQGGAIGATKSKNKKTNRPTELVEAFTRFERSDPLFSSSSPSCSDPAAAARLARWTVIYATLQILAEVSVDCPGVRYKDESSDFSHTRSPSPSSVVGYHLSATTLKNNKKSSGGSHNSNMARIPPWKSPSKEEDSAINNVWEARHDGSYCWVAPWVLRLQQQQSGGAGSTAGGARDESGRAEGGGGGGGGSAVMNMLRAQADQFPRPPQQPHYYPPPGTATTTGGRTTVMQQQQQQQRSTTMRGGVAINSSNHNLALGGHHRHQQPMPPKQQPLSISIVPPPQGPPPAGAPPMSPSERSTARGGGGGGSGIMRDSGAYVGGNNNRDSAAYSTYSSSSSAGGGGGGGQKHQQQQQQQQQHMRGRGMDHNNNQRHHSRSTGGGGSSRRAQAPTPLPLMKGVTGTGMFYGRNEHGDILEEEGSGHVDDDEKNDGRRHGDDHDVDDDGLDIVIHDFDEMGVATKTTS